MILEHLGWKTATRGCVVGACRGMLESHGILKLPQADRQRSRNEGRRRTRPCGQGTSGRPDPTPDIGEGHRKRPSVSGRRPKHWGFLIRTPKNSSECHCSAGQRAKDASTPHVPSSCFRRLHPTALHQVHETEEQQRRQVEHLFRQPLGLGPNVAHHDWIIAVVVE